MTAEDRLRGRLRSAASEMPVGSGSLAGVQARAAQLQRRRNAARGGVGAFALVAVALVGVVSLRNGGTDEYGTTMAESDAAAETAAMPATTAAVVASAAEEDMADEEMATEAAASDDETQQDVLEASGDEAAGVTAPPDSEALEQEMADESENWDSTPPASSDPDTAVFATTVSIVRPPPEAEGADMRYSFSGAHAVARAADNWYAYDGADWQSAEPPEVPMPEADQGDRGGPKPLVLHETTLLGVATSVEVSGGMAWLKHGEQVWEVCPIADDELNWVHGEVGRAGEHLAVVVGKPEQTLFVVQRTE